MKKEFQVLKERPRLTIVLTRDSVCAADDLDAPHEKKIEVYSFLDAVDLAREASSGYLPFVDGVGHSWTCILNDVKLAEVTTNGIHSLVPETEFRDSNRIHFAHRSARH